MKLSSPLREMIRNKPICPAECQKGLGIETLVSSEVGVKDLGTKNSLEVEIQVYFLNL